jgi:hypothetical protein
MVRRSLSAAIQLGLLVLIFVLSPSARAFTPITMVPTGNPASNVADTSFTVTWITDQAVPGSGSVCFGTSTTNIACRVPESPNGGSGYVHSATVGGLSPSTTYYYYVTVSAYVGDNNGSPFSVKTGPTFPSPTPTFVATGKVVVSNSNGSTQPANGVLVLLQVLDSTGTSRLPVPATSGYMSAITLADGSFSIVLRPRSADASQQFAIPSSSGDSLLYSVEGGAYGDVGPLSASIPATPGTIAVQQIALIPSSTTDTPLPVTATSTYTPVPTATSTPVPPSATLTFTPEVTVSPTPTSPTIEPAVEQAASPTEPGNANTSPPPSVATPLPQPPPLAPAPTEPPRPTPVPSLSPISTPIGAAPPAPVDLVSPPPATIQPLAPSTTISAPGIVAPAPRETTVGFRAPATRTPLPTLVVATATTTAPGDDTVSSSLPTDDTLSRSTIAFLASLGLIAAGIVVVTVGIVRQLRLP